MKVIVTGARGMIGSQLADRLVAEGHDVSTVSRSSQAGPRTIQWANPDGEEFPADSLEGVDVIVHLAGEPIAEHRWSDEQRRRIRDSRILSTRNLVSGVGRVSARPKALICASAIGYYGDRGEEVLTERSAPGTGFLAETCVEWEAEAASARDLGLRVAMVRIGVVLSTTGGALSSMLGVFRAGLGGSLGSGRQWFPWVHLDDVVGILRHAILNSSVGGPINAVAPGCVTNAQFTGELAGALHRPAFFWVPEAVLTLVLGDLSRLLLSSAKVVPAVAEETGYAFKYRELRPALESLVG